MPRASILEHWLVEWAFCSTIISHKCGISPAKVSNCFISHSQSYAVCLLSEVIHHCCDIQTPLSLVPNGLKTIDASGGMEYPQGLVLNSCPTKEPSPTIQRLRSCLGKPVVVIQVYCLRGSSAPTAATAWCSSHPAPVSVSSSGDSKVMSSKVAPSRHVHSPIYIAYADDLIASLMIVKYSWSTCLYTQIAL